MTQAITTTPTMPDLTVADIRKYICPKATEQEAFMFLRLCQAQNLNPFTREAYLIKYGSNDATMVIGKDGFTRRAEEHPKFAGFRAGIITDSEQHGIMEREGAFFAPGETLVGGWAEVHRNDRSVPFRATVRMEEYNARQGQWNKMPATMIRKVALVQALREAFPSSFAGLYDAAEMGVDGDTLPTTSVVIDATATEMPRKGTQEGQQAGHQVAGVLRPSREQYAEIKKHRERLGWSTDELIANIGDPLKMTPDEAAKAINALGQLPTPQTAGAT